jgi:hypothetical protein
VVELFVGGRWCADDDRGEEGQFKLEATTADDADDDDDDDGDDGDDVTLSDECARRPGTTIVVVVCVGVFVFGDDALLSE